MIHIRIYSLDTSYASNESKTKGGDISGKAMHPLADKKEVGNTTLGTKFDYGESNASCGSLAQFACMSPK